LSLGNVVESLGLELFSVPPILNGEEKESRFPLGFVDKEKQQTVLFENAAAFCRNKQI
jgi:hypothetical protein